MPKKRIFRIEGHRITSFTPALVSSSTKLLIIKVERWTLELAFLLFCQVLTILIYLLIIKIRFRN